ncbi:MAG: polysaccharide pyruvyl transferase family protein [Ruminococcaceae bacterium]|nr:polysaccharide pyruvyl transferase family protein [Oscillospiraceae bacterium]
MKKVGLITYYGDNYGGVLQAYALQQMVRANHCSCELISNDFLYQPNGTKKFWGKWANLTAILKDPKGYFAKRKVYHQYAGQRKAKAEKFRAFREQNLTVHKTGYTSYEQYVQNPPVYDVYLCGSDQIWNPNLYCDNGFYFAGFAPETALKISYASSIGVSTVTKKQAAFMAPLLNRLDVISTREQKGADIIDAVSEKKATVVLDPTLLLNAEEWSAVAAPRMIEEPYIFCYVFGERDYIETVKQTVKEQTGMKVVCIPFVPRELDSDDEKIFDAGPAEFISLIKHASLVLTDSFHATAFSINLKTPFLSLCRFSKSDKKGMNDRLVTILNTVGLRDRLVDANEPFSREFLFDIDFEKAHSLLDRKRQADRQFLSDALQYKKP